MINNYGTDMADYQSSHRLRDIIFLMILIILVVYSYRKTMIYVSMHEKTLIHELDRDFADSLFTAQRQVRITKSIFVQEPAISPEMQKIMEKIERSMHTIEERYGTNSPGLLLLGPIGTASIVMKEEELKGKLLETLNLLSIILHYLSKMPGSVAQSTSIAEALSINQNFITILLKQKDS